MENRPIEIRIDEQRPMSLFSRRFGRNPYPTLKKMQEMAAAVPVSDNGLRVWVVTRYHDVKWVLNGRVFAKDVMRLGRDLVNENKVPIGKTPNAILDIRRGMVDRDGPDHRRLRSLLSHHFTQEAVDRWEPRIEEIAAAALELLPTGEPVDMLARYARPVAARVIAERLGIPDDYVEVFPDLETRLVTGDSLDDVHVAEAAFHDFSRAMLELKSREPSDDIYTELLRVHQNDPAMLSETELISTYVMLAIAGSEAASALGNCLYALASHPDQLSLLYTDPGLIDSAIDECLRFEPSFRILSPRYAEEPVELGGVVLPSRSLLVCSIAAANRDPEKFPEPDRFDITRHPNHHLSFSHGPHICLGSRLARSEIKVAIRTLLDRFSDMRMAVNQDDLAWRPGMYMRRLRTIPMVLGA